MASDPTSDWDPSVPFVAERVPAFPIAALPEWLSAYVLGVTEAMQTPVDLAALLGLAVVALACAKRVRMQVRDDWFEPTNIYVVIALKSGEGKSPIFRAMLKPVFDHELAAAAAVAAEIATAQEQVACLAERQKVLRTKAGKTGNPEDRAAAEAIAVEMRSIKVPVEPRLLLTDATPEAMARRLSEQGGRIGLFSAEAGPFENLAGRYSNGRSNLEIVLAAHSGDHYTVDRIGSESFVLDAPALTVALTVQPSVISGLARKPDFRGRGLLARFFYSLPISRVGMRVAEPETIPPSAKLAYERVMVRLLTCPAHEAGEPSDSPCTLVLAEDAGAMLIDLKRAIEPRLGDGGDLSAIADWANKLTGAVARIAGILHVAEHADRDASEFSATVTGSTMTKAIDVGHYLLAHAVAAFAVMAADPAVDDARHVLAWLERRKPRTVCVRDLYRAMEAQFPKAEAIEPALALLVDHGYLRQVETPAGRNGRPPSPKYDVHPDIWQTKPTQAKPGRSSVSCGVDPPSPRGDAEETAPRKNGRAPIPTHEAQPDTCPPEPTKPNSGWGSVGCVSDPPSPRRDAEETAPRRSGRLPSPECVVQPDVCRTEPTKPRSGGGSGGNCADPALASGESEDRERFTVEVMA